MNISFRCTSAVRILIEKALASASVPVRWGNRWRVAVEVYGHEKGAVRLECDGEKVPVSGVPKIVQIENAFEDSWDDATQPHWCLPDEEEGELKKLAEEYMETARRYTAAAFEIRRRYAPAESWWVAFSSTCGSCMSVGYAAGPLSSREEAEAERDRMEREDEELRGDGNVVTRYYILGPGDHECTVPSWGACRQCHDEK